jgi:hypothetical protein
MSNDKRLTIFGNIYFSGAKDGMPILKGSLSLGALREAVEAAREQGLTHEGEKDEYLKVVFIPNWKDNGDREKWNNRFYAILDTPRQDDGEGQEAKGKKKKPAF